MRSSLGIIPVPPIFPTLHRCRLHEMFVARLPYAGRMSPLARRPFERPEEFRRTIVALRYA